MPRQLMITVDVEAQPQRAERDHIDRLIWGGFPSGRAGISEMMDIADRSGVKLTMFLDWAEVDLYGNAINDVGREIKRRGHDLQLHVHTNFFSPSFWQRHGIESAIDLNFLSRGQAEAIATEIVRRHRLISDTPPLAFRGGSYRYCPELIDALALNEVKIDSTVNLSRDNQPLDLDISSQFRWPNGVVEVPVSCLTTFRNSPRVVNFNFNSAYFPTAKTMIQFLRIFWNTYGSDAIAVLVMHSWSLLRLDINKKYFEFDNGDNIERFSEFVDLLSHDRGLSVVDARDLSTMAAAGELVVGASPPTMNRLSGIRMGRSVPMDIVEVKDVESLAGEAERLWNENPGNLISQCRSVALFRAAYEAGDRVRSGYRLGTAYYYGRGIKKDLSEAFKYLSDPLLNNSRFALYFRGMILSSKIFSGYNETLAIQVLRKAHDLGVVAAAQRIQQIMAKDCPER